MTDRRYAIIGHGSLTFLGETSPVVLKELISSPAVDIMQKDEHDMRMNGLMGALVASAALAASPAAPAVMPARQSGKTAHAVPSRKDRKRISAARYHARNAATNRTIRGRGSKLGRRLRRKFELGMNGAF